jgi:hypothetical protein
MCTDRHGPLDVDRARQKVPCLVGCQIDANARSRRGEPRPSAFDRADATIWLHGASNRTTPAVDSAVSASMRGTSTQLSLQIGTPNFAKRTTIVSESRGPVDI